MRTVQKLDMQEIHVLNCLDKIFRTSTILSICCSLLFVFAVRTAINHAFAAGESRVFSTEPVLRVMAAV